jgi:plasmid stabilization system protein ParE
VTRIRWTTEAADQLAGIVQHILKDNPQTARKVARAILDRIEDLELFPALAAPARKSKAPANW